MSAPVVCVECGAELATGQERCWLCQRSLEPQATAPPTALNPYTPPRPMGDVAAAQFSLTSLFLITTLVAVFLGVFLLAPGLGVLLAVIAVPALARTLLVNYRKRQWGTPLSPQQKVGAFLLSFGLMFLVGWAGMIAFCGVCLGAVLGSMALGGNNDFASVVALGGGGLAAFSVVALLLWVTRPRAPLAPQART